MIDKGRAPAADDRPTMLPRSPLREAAGWATVRVAAGLNACCGHRRDCGFGILMYHRVTDHPKGADTPTNNVTPQRLRQQLTGLLDRGFRPWTLDALLDACRDGRPIPPQTFAVTFDDGFENNLTDALPVLQDLDVPATIFLVTGFLDSRVPMPSDNWADAGSTAVPESSWRTLTTAQCDELLASGVIQLGAHTHTHELFRGRADAFYEDLAESVDVMDRKFGIANPTFAFPFGITSPELVDAARRAGVRCALTTRPDCVQPSEDPFHWGRFGATQQDTPTTLAAKLGGWYSPLARTLRALQRPLVSIVPKSTREMLLIRNSSFAFPAGQSPAESQPSPEAQHVDAS
ncbi:MAG: polysaccharide deacetylase family protein [Planctomycetota bacterium]|nr:MAG: polysaccharide deacetylase family protein [Planctomycetota bacterium]